jgi:hypothetical protein
MLRALPVGAKPSEVWRTAAFALLRLSANECEALGLVFEDETASDEVRGWVLDLLAGAGTFEAQVVIRRLLALGVARRNNRTFASFVQRLGMVECPDGPTLRFLMSVYAESRSEPHDVRAACAYALGAAAGQAFVGADPDAAVRASDVLRRDLLAAGTLTEKCALLAALGNAGVASDVVVLTRFTQDAEAPVRASAALALRKMTGPEATAQLVSLLADTDVKVTQSALHALADHKLEEEELDQLAEMVLSGRTSMVIDSRVLRLIVAQKPRLRTMPGRAGAIEHALRLLLGRVEAAANGELTGSGERAVAVQPFATIKRAPLPEAKVRTLLGNPQQPTSLNHNPLAATVIDQPPIQLGSGTYSVVHASVANRGLVNPGDSVETVRARMLELGLDPNARCSIIPQPPPRRAVGESPTSRQPAATLPVRGVTRLQPNAIQRNR